jgi:hypothetical protein
VVKDSDGEEEPSVKFKDYEAKDESQSKLGEILKTQESAKSNRSVNPHRKHKNYLKELRQKRVIGSIDT